ncbi:hypothetical protein AB0F46_30445 [Streptomyces sp. NPDC026665]|uniref:hypothetical protein n=1 Tax=Streptomyces sp. NPDC026665 TaxID=3154798 RepID=UPI0033D453A7
MRSILVTKSLLAATLGCVVLSACGTENRSASAGHAPSAATVHPANRHEQSPAGSPEARFLELIGSVMETCAPNTPEDTYASDEQDGSPAPQPEDLLDEQGTETPRYGPGQTPPGVPDADGDIPVPLPSDVPEPPKSTATTRPRPAREVPLTEVERCNGTEHARRITSAFQGTTVNGYQDLLDGLKRLDYPGSRIHRMPERADAPRVRLDLRFMGGRLVLEVTGTDTGVTVEQFGAPETEDMKVTDVERAA